MKRAARIALSVIVLAALYLGVAPLQRRLTSMKTDEWLKMRMSFLPKTDVLEPILLGFETTYANFLWFKTVNYYGTHRLTDRSYPWLTQMVDMVTRLNPHFEPAYEWAGLFIPDDLHNPEAARVILNRGITHIGDRSFKVYLYQGLIHFKHYNDRKTAADFFAMGSRVPSEHSWKLGRMAATFYAQAGVQTNAVSLLSFLIQTAESPAIREVLQERLERLMQQRRDSRAASGRQLMQHFGM